MGRVAGFGNAVGFALVALGAAALARDSGVVAAALAVLAAAGFLRALCLGAPPWQRLVRATLALLLPAAVVQCIAFLVPALPRGLLLGAAFLAGLAFAIFTLRAYVRSERPLERIGTLRALVVCGAACTFVAIAFGGYHARLHQGERELETEAVLRSNGRDGRPGSVTLADRSTLRADNALFAPGPYRNADVTARVTLGADAILQIRLRLPNAAWPDGVSFFLSADPRFASGFFADSRVDFDRLGEAAGIAPAETPLDVRVVLRGRRLEALVDGTPVAAVTTRTDPEGAIALLAAHGTVDIADARVRDVTPLEFAESAPGTARDRLAGGAAALAFLFLFAGAVALFLRVSFLRALEPAVYGMLPVAWVFACALSPHDLVATNPLVPSLAAGSFVLLLFPQLHAQRMNGPQFALIALLVLGGAVAAFAYGQRRAWPIPMSGEAVHKLSLADWSGTRLEPHLVHFQHPALRRWNLYLSLHEVSLRTPPLETDPSRARVLFLGGSSTQGYFLKVPYPFEVQLELERRGQPIEAMNGAVVGGTGARLYWLLRNALIEWRPDVVVLSLYYNDAFALTQMDEAAYLYGITAEDKERTWFGRLKDRFRVTQGARTLDALRAAFAAGRGDEIAAAAAGDDAPPARFERMLRDYAALCRTHGIRLVLVKEPLKGDRPRLWKDEFYAAMDRVAQEFGLKVVDPRSRLATEDPDSMFIPNDEIHPSETGARIIAACIADALGEP